MPGGRDINIKLRPKKQINDLIIPRTASVGSRLISSIRNIETKDLKNYLVLKTIGKGNFAKVKLAEHKLTKKEVAIKIIDKTKIPADSLQKLFREVLIIKSLQHPNIVRLYEVIQTENMIYLIMEYVSGGELFDNLVNSGRMKEVDARSKFRQAVSAIQYCHARKIVHRDLKAENLLLDSDGNIKIADFGFCNEYDGITNLNTFCGSPPYAAPELFLGQPYLGPEVDIWSLGVILFTMVTGTLPFDGETIKELRKSVLSCRYRVPFYMSNGCEALLRKMIVKEPSHRSSLDEIMKDEWLNGGYSESCHCVPYNEPQELMNDVVRINTMKKMGIDPVFINQSLEKLDYNHIMATYLLLNKSKVDANFVNISPKSKSDTSENNIDDSIPEMNSDDLKVENNILKVSNKSQEEESPNENKVSGVLQKFEESSCVVHSTNSTNDKELNFHAKSTKIVKTESSFRNKAFSNAFSFKIHRSKKNTEVSEEHSKAVYGGNDTITGEKKNNFYRRFTVAMKRPTTRNNETVSEKGKLDMNITNRSSHAANIHKIVNASPKEVINDLEAVLTNNNYSFIRKNTKNITVTIPKKGNQNDNQDLLKIEFELTKLWFSKKYAIKLNRLRGTSISYKNISRKILALYCDYVIKKRNQE